MKILLTFPFAFAEPVLHRVTRESESASSPDLQEARLVVGYGGQDRRYWQLMEQILYFNPAFDQRKFWAYGCNCLLLGDRPMSDPGYGPPVDELDTVCKHYKDCAQCAKKKHGDECINEFKKYKFSESFYEKGNASMCKNEANSCERDLCECDFAFAKAHVQAIGSFVTDYHLFWTETGWYPEDNCPKTGGTAPVTPECCFSPTGPAVLYNRKGLNQ
ncbi:unnamed protein product [Oikopleura dioica]|uniref:Phospholipase A2-like central domain-containing protein n=1 Tax=Oikopleura dioica TaxID=34765 RepID=E4YMN8_OIKDI|nr:unnamed protein product [Oikopleura dioica]